MEWSFSEGVDLLLNEAKMSTTRDIPAGTGMVLGVGEFSTRRSSCSCETLSPEAVHDSGRDNGE